MPTYRARLSTVRDGSARIRLSKEAMALAAQNGFGGSNVLYCVVEGNRLAFYKSEAEAMSAQCEQ